eukprot:3325856-Amphidinium_carterae.1
MAARNFPRLRLSPALEPDNHGQHHESATAFTAASVLVRYAFWSYILLECRPIRFHFYGASQAHCTGMGLTRNSGSTRKRC